MNLVAIGEGGMVAMEYHREMAIEGVTLRPIDEANATIPVVVAWDPAVEDPVAGSFVAFIRDQARLAGQQPADAWRTPDPLP